MDQQICYIYCRFSKRSPLALKSIFEQEKICKKFADVNKYRVVEVVNEISSGFIPSNKRGIQPRLLDLVNRMEPNSHLLIKDSDRFSRNVEYAKNIISKLKEKSCVLHCLLNNINTVDKKNTDTILTRVKYAYEDSVNKQLKTMAIHDLKKGVLFSRNRVISKRCDKKTNKIVNRNTDKKRNSNNNSKNLDDELYILNLIELVKTGGYKKKLREISFSYNLENLNSHLQDFLPVRVKAGFMTMKELSSLLTSTLALSKCWTPDKISYHYRKYKNHMEVDSD